MSAVLIRTRRPILPRIRARIDAWRLALLIESHEREVDTLVATFEALPDQIDQSLARAEALRVQLALAIKNA